MFTKGMYRAKIMGLSLKDLARRVNRVEQYISNVLNGRTKPSRELLEQLGEILELLPEEVQEPMEDVLPRRKTTKDTTCCG